MTRIVRGVVTLVLAGTLIGAMAGVADAKPLSESQFKKQGDAICKAGNKALDPVYEQYFGDLGENEEPDQASIDAVLVVIVPNIQGQIDAVDALEEPKSLSKGVAKFLAEAQRALDVLDADHSLFIGSDDLFAKTSKLAKKVGLKACAS